jgi:transcription termination factor Rho
MRAPRDRRPPASPASYAEQAERGGPLTTRRNLGNQGGRRGQTDSRGGRPSRDGGSMYTHSPAPTGPESRYGYGQRQPAPAAPARTVEVSGVLWLGGGQGMSPAEVLDERNLLPLARINPEDVRRYGLRSGDLISGMAEERAGRRHIVQIESVNEAEPETQRDRPLFEQLTATFPERRVRLEQGTHPPVSTRLIDLFAPLGFGSRALVVAPPKTGKTTLIREAAEAVLTGYPNAVVMAVLVGERPEEVTDLRARLEPRGGLVYAASFDEETERHAWLVQVAVERAKRVAESGRDAFMVLDSLTRLARAENLATRGAGRTLSGGIDAQALDTGRRAFGAARNLDEGGSLTILATCLVDTGSRQDDVVYEEFKGTGNMELHLSRELSQRRLFPAVDVIKSGTRREEMLLTPEELRATTALRRRLADVPPAQATQQLLNVLERTQSNAALLQALEQSGWLTSAR